MAGIHSDQKGFSMQSVPSSSTSTSINTLSILSKPYVVEIPGHTPSSAMMRTIQNGLQCVLKTNWHTVVKTVNTWRDKEFPRLLWWYPCMCPQWPCYTQNKWFNLITRFWWQCYLPIDWLDRTVLTVGRPEDVAAPKEKTGRVSFWTVGRNPIWRAPSGRNISPKEDRHTGILTDFSTQTTQAGSCGQNPLSRVSCTSRDILYPFLVHHLSPG